MKSIKKTKMKNTFKIGFLALAIAVSAAACKGKSGAGAGDSNVFPAAFQNSDGFHAADLVWRYFGAGLQPGQD